MLPAPTDIGIPDFPEWRSEQIDGIVKVLDTDKRFTAAVLPVGTGKSLFATGAAKLLGGRAVALTGTKPLQEQYLRDFQSAGMVSVKGQNAYACTAVNPGEPLEHYADDDRPAGVIHSVEQGPCHSGVPCALKEEGCGYYDAVRAFTKSELGITNYTFWMAQYKYGRGLGFYRTLILDEAHSVPERLAEFLTVQLRRHELDFAHLRLPDNPESVGSWRDWARLHKRMIQAKLDGWVPQTHEDMKQHRRGRAILRKLVALAEMDDSDDPATSAGWIVIPEKDGPPGWKFCALWAQRQAEELLYLKTPKVIAMSATLTKKTLSLMGIPEADYEWHEAPSSFPVERRPITWIPTVRVDYRIQPWQEKMLVERCDQIIASRKDRKGLIHCVSYKRRNMLLEHSRFKDKMISHDAASLASTIERFKSMPDGYILVSPSIATGYDFAYTAAEWQIILKIPFPVTVDPVMKARTEKDKEYPLYLAMQELVQATGRVMRAPDDLGETFILDDNWAWVQRRKELAPRYFWDAVKKSEVIPAAPPRLPRE